MYSCPICNNIFNIIGRDQYYCKDCRLHYCTNYLVNHTIIDKVFIKQGAKIGFTINFYYWKNKNWLPHNLENFLKLKSFW